MTHQSSRPAVPPHLTAAGREPHEPPPRSRAELDAVMRKHGYDGGYCAAMCKMPCGCRWRVGECGPFQAAFHALSHLNSEAEPANGVGQWGP